MKRQKLVIDEDEHIYLDDVEIPNVKEYILKSSPGKPTELTLTIFVTIKQVYPKLES